MQASLQYYSHSGPITNLNIVANLLNELPTTLPDLCRLTQGLLIHPFEVNRYGVKVPRKRWKELDICEVATMLQRLWELERSPLNVLRQPQKRLLGNCRDYATLLCAFLRFQQIPARVRYGFATYFEADFYTDHVVCEYWERQQQRWIVVDAQIDNVLRPAYSINLDTLDLPQSAFLVAGQAWQLYRSKIVDPTKFGISQAGPQGVEFIRTGVLHELAALNKVELLCQDEWDVELEEQLQMIDQLAEWTVQPDTMFNQLRNTFDQEMHLSIPARIKTYYSSID